MGYNGNNRKPYNIWRTSTHKRGLNLLIPKARKPKYSLFKRNKAVQATFSAQRYNLSTDNEKTPTIEEKRQNSDKWGCVLCSVLTIAVLLLIGWAFGWIWCIAIPTMLIIFMLIQN